MRYGTSSKIMTLGAVHHVSNLEEAISLYAAARMAGAQLPTFTTTIEEWPTFEEDVRQSYSVAHEVGRKTYRWEGVVLYVTAIDHKPLCDFELHNEAPQLLQ